MAAFGGGVVKLEMRGGHQLALCHSIENIEEKASLKNIVSAAKHLKEMK